MTTKAWKLHRRQIIKIFWSSKEYLNSICLVCYLLLNGCTESNQISWVTSLHKRGASTEALRGVKSHQCVAIYKKKCGFSMGRNQYWAGRVYSLCVYFNDGSTRKAQPKVVLWRSRESNLWPLVYKAYAYPLHHSGFFSVWWFIMVPLTMQF